MSTPLRVTVSRLRQRVTPADHVRGAPDAPVTLVEYADFQCPYSAAAHSDLRALLRERSDVVRLVFRHFPLANVHPYAELVAETAESAGEHGRFWPMHDWLFEHQEQLDPVHLALGAEQVGLPVDDLAGEVNSHARLDRIQRDFVSGIRSGVDATPAFFVNGVRHTGGYDVAHLLAAVDEACRG
ncbi:MAG TPA: DsbA family protein [Micromonosporaceae bacterium]|nr:DsbA family protein [Micromonosporaceae bacterium]